jgi:hypothetical protein
MDVIKQTCGKRAEVSGANIRQIAATDVPSPTLFTCFLDLPLEIQWDVVTYLPGKASCRLFMASRAMHESYLRALNADGKELVNKLGDPAARAKLLDKNLSPKEVDEVYSWDSHLHGGVFDPDKGLEDIARLLEGKQIDPWMLPQLVFNNYPLCRDTYFMCGGPLPFDSLNGYWFVPPRDGLNGIGKSTTEQLGLDTLSVRAVINRGEDARTRWKQVAERVIKTHLDLDQTAQKALWRLTGELSSLFGLCQTPVALGRPEGLEQEYAGIGASELSAFPCIKKYVLEGRFPYRLILSLFPTGIGFDGRELIESLLRILDPQLTDAKTSESVGESMSRMCNSLITFVRKGFVGKWAFSQVDDEGIKQLIDLGANTSKEIVSAIVESNKKPR